MILSKYLMNKNIKFSTLFLSLIPGHPVQRLHNLILPHPELPQLVRAQLPAQPPAHQPPELQLLEGVRVAVPANQRLLHQFLLPPIGPLAGLLPPNPSSDMALPQVAAGTAADL